MTQVPATDLELAAVVAVSAAYAASRNDTSVGELLRAVGRLGESTVRKGLNATFGPPTSTTLQAQPSMPLPKQPQPIEVSRPRREVPPRPLDARSAAAVRAEARRELEAVSIAERDLRLFETQLRAAVARKAKRTSSPPCDHEALGVAIRSLDNVKATLNSEATDNMARDLRNGLDKFESKLRHRQTQLRAILYDADHDAHAKRREQALANLNHELKILTARRQAATAKLAQASVCLVRTQE